MQILSFVTWMERFTNEEFSLMRHRMRAVQWMGPNIQRRFDEAMALNWIDLDDPVMPQFKQQLVAQNVLSADRAELIFDPTGASPTPPSEGGGSVGPAGPPGPAGTSMVTGAGAPTQDAPVGTVYLDSVTGDLYQFT